jgi:hypothetical protein
MYSEGDVFVGTSCYLSVLLLLLLSTAVLLQPSNLSSISIYTHHHSIPSHPIPFHSAALLLAA